MQGSGPLCLVQSSRFNVQGFGIGGWLGVNVERETLNRAEGAALNPDTAVALDRKREAQPFRSKVSAEG
jgi:hypothetical protein